MFLSLNKNETISFKGQPLNSLNGVAMKNLKFARLLLYNNLQNIFRLK